MPGIDGYETCRRIRADPSDLVPAGGHGHRQRRRGEAAQHRGRRGRLRHQAVRSGRAAGAGPLAAAGQAVPRHHRAAGGRAGGLEPQARGPGRRPGRGARAPGPAPPLPVSPGRRPGRRSGDETFLDQPPPRDRRGLLRPARVHRVRRVVRARGGDGRAGRVPRGARRPDFRFEATVGSSPGTGSWCSSTIRCRAPTRRLVRCAWRWRCATWSRTWLPAGAVAATTSASASGSPRATPPSAGSGFQGRYDYAAIGTVTNLAARLGGPAGPGRSSSPSA